MNRATVSAGYVGNLFQFATANGADAAGLLAAAGLSAEALDDPDARVPMARYRAMMRAAQQRCDMPWLPLELGASRDFRDISIVGLICYAAPTMGEALNELNRYVRLAAEVSLPGRGPRFQLVTHDSGLWMVDTRQDPGSFPEMTESTWSRFICETARHFPEATFARAAHFTHPRPAYGDHFERVLKVPVTFDSHWNALRIDPSWLTIELHQPNRYVFGVLTRHADSLLDALRSGETVRGRVEAAVLPILHRGEPDMTSIASALGLTRPTLYRRLRAEGAGFDELIDQLRRRMAMEYLSGGRASVNETAYLVGFSEPSAFSRAFKRWTGLSPGAWKARQGIRTDAVGG
ncbi:MAG: AraC family transcriptional regulator ligand-binding domain-containing protein [Caulobacter sp.]|nr:AraC family transcriptional regulator ligand-binding domain-containing protein [Caulobacter sp.]